MYPMSMLPLELAGQIVDFELAAIVGLVGGKLLKVYMRTTKKVK